MDFWEGVFLGPVWSHTDYQDRKHPGFHFAVGLVALAYLALHFFLTPFDFLFPIPAFVYLGITLVLILVLPFTAAKYYARALPMKIITLVSYALQYILAWLFIVKTLVSNTSIDPMDAFLSLGELANNIMAGMAEFFSFLGGLPATLAGVISGAVLMGLAGILIFILAVYTPLFVFFLIKRIQRLVDRFVLKQYYSDRIQTF